VAVGGAYGTPQLRAFHADLDRFNVLVERRTAGAVAALGAIIRRNLALRTPFDTGRCAASWNASVNGANKRKQPPEFVVASRQEAAQYGEVNLQGVRLGDKVVISNSQDYVWRLNAGWSPQAPAGFVEQVVEVIRARQYDRILQKMVGSIRR
jgi:hypothetical protein